MDTTSPAPTNAASTKRQPELIALGRALRELRARRGLSQEALGHACNTHRNYVGAIERGEINPTFRVLLRIGGGLRLPLSELIEIYERQLAPWRAAEQAPTDGVSPGLDAPSHLAQGESCVASRSASWASRSLM